MTPIQRAALLLLVVMAVAAAPNADAQNGKLWVLCQTSVEGPCGYPTNWSITGAMSFTGTQTSVNFSVPPGDYAIQYLSGGPPGNWTVSIRPTSPVTIDPGEEDAFTIVFTQTCVSVSTPNVTAPTGTQGTNAYTLTWNESSSSDDQWEVVELIGSSVQSTQIVTTPSATFSHTVSSPTTYTYRIRSTNPCGHFSASAERQVHVFPPNYVPPAFNPNFNFDGNADLLWWNSATGVLYAQFMNGTAATGGAVIVSEPNTAWQVVGTGDTDLDGDTEILMQNTNTRLPFLYRVNGAAYVDGREVFRRGNGDAAFPAYANGRAITLADFSGDGRADMLWRNDAGVIDILLLNGLDVVGRQPLWREPDTNWKIVAAADADGDGDADAYWRNAVTGMCFLTLAQGGAQVWHHEPDLSWSLVGVADVSGDDKADAIWRHTDGRVWVQLRDGFTAGVSGFIWVEPDAAWQINGLGDVNGDGRHDLIWRNTDGRVFVILLDGLSVIGSGIAHYEPNPNWVIASPAGTTETF